MAKSNRLMHPRNIYRKPPDFNELTDNYPRLSEFLLPCDNGKSRIDFKNPRALRTLTEILLHKDFGLSVEIPEYSIIPTVPQRLNYILWIEDLIKEFLPSTDNIYGIDIGTGPCTIFALLGAKKNGWHFIATEVNEKSLSWAEKNIEHNGLQDMIKVVKTDKKSILEDVCAEESMTFHFCMCNPPFFGGSKDSQRRKQLLHNPQKEETVTEGGEIEFVKRILEESLVLKNKIRIFSSMLGRKCSFVQIVKVLKSKGIKYRWCEFNQGKTRRWGIAWTFENLQNFEQDFQVLQRCSKTKKPDFSFIISFENGSKPPFKSVYCTVLSLLHRFQVSFKVIQETSSDVCLLILSYVNSWTYNRKKRREALRNMKKNTFYHDSVMASNDQITFEACGKQDGYLTTCKESCVGSLEGGSSAYNTVKLSRVNLCQPLFSCKLMLTNAQRGEVKVQFVRAGCINDNVVYQFFQTFKNVLSLRFNVS